MQLLSIFLFAVLTIAIICGVVLISIPLFKLSNFFRRSKRPIFIIKHDQGHNFVIKNTGTSECQIIDIFLENDMTYFESLNGTSFAPGQKALLKLPQGDTIVGQISIRYQDTSNKKFYEQKFSLTNL